MRIHLLAICPLAVLIAGPLSQQASANPSSDSVTNQSSELEPIAESDVLVEDAQISVVLEAKLQESSVVEHTHEPAESAVEIPSLPPASVEQLSEPVDVIKAKTEQPTRNESEVSGDTMPGADPNIESSDIQVVFLDEVNDYEANWPEQVKPQTVVSRSHTSQNHPTERSSERSVPQTIADQPQEYLPHQTPISVNPEDTLEVSPSAEDAESDTVLLPSEPIVLPEQAIPRTVVFEPRSQTSQNTSTPSEQGQARQTSQTATVNRYWQSNQVSLSIDDRLEVSPFADGDKSQESGPVAAATADLTSADLESELNNLQSLEPPAAVSTFRSEQLHWPELATPQTLVFEPRSQTAAQSERSSENTTSNVDVKVSQASPDDQTDSADDFLQSPPAVDTIDPADLENELGDIQILDQPTVQPTPQPTAQLILRSSVFTSSNVSGQEDSAVGDVITGSVDNDDIIFANSAFLLATPEIGPNTRLISSVGGGFVRFGDNGDANYDFLNLNLAAQHRITPAVYGEFGVNWQQLYTTRNGERALSDVSPRLRIGRQDVLGDRLRLDSLYELRFRLTDPKEQQRISNSLGVRLNYELTPEWRSGLEYRLTLEDFTQDTRFDVRNLVRAVTTYNFTENSFVSGSLSYLFGSSSKDSVDIDNFSVGVSVGFNVPF